MELFKKCGGCNKELPITDFTKTRCKFFPGGVLPLCNHCLDLITMAPTPEEQWNKVNKLCQWADVPFVPKEWEKVKAGGENSFNRYCKIFAAKELETVDWSEYNKIYLELNQRNDLEDEIPGYSEKKYEKLMKKWGSYEKDELDALEDLFNETIATQNVTTGNQIDQVKKICKTSLLIDQRINEGVPYKDLMDSYEKLIKVADLAPKNTKNSNDFDSTGEVCDYLETIGWVNKCYDGADRDEVDSTMHNIQNWIRKLSIGESTLTEEILQKLNNLNDFKNDDTDYDNFDYDAFDKEATDTLKEQEVEVEI